jgi:protein SCO1
MIDWRQFVFAGLIVSVLVSCHLNADKHSADLPFYNSSEFTPHWLSEKDADTIHAIPHFSFIDQDGQTITRNTFTGKITVVNFFFTRCPGICKKLTNNLLSVQSAFKDDNNVLLLSHSVTPESDSIAVLKKYAEEYKVISGKWHLVTGNKNEIYAIARKAYFADEDMGWKQDSTTFLHTENILLIDKKHHIRGIYKGTIPSDINNLIADIKTLEKE